MSPTPSLLTGLKPFWMINDAATVDERLAYVRACHAGGIRALAIHCRAGNLIPYSSRDWYEMTAAIAEEGKRLGMEIWLYDEDPYPSGAAGGRVMDERGDLRAESLETVEMSADITPGRLWIIGPDRVVWAGLVPTDTDREMVEMTDRTGTVRRDWALSEWDSRYYYEEMPQIPCERGNAVNQNYAMFAPEVPEGYRMLAITATIVGKEGSWGSLPALLNPETWEKYRELALQPYVEHVGHLFGTTIPGIFTDEAKPNGSYPLAPDLFDDFRATFGYDLHARLPHLFGPALSDDYLKTRVDYRRWVGERFLSAFVRPYRKWCDDNNLLLVGHFSPEDDPIPEVSCLSSVMPIMKTMSLPGTDVIVPATGDANAPTLNLGSVRAGSLKSQFDLGYATSETLGLSGWDNTSEKCRQIYAWQKVLGVDRFFTHGFWTTHDGPCNYEAPPSFGPGSSYFRGTTAQDAWLDRLDAVMDGSKEAADVAIVSPITSFWTLPFDQPPEERAYIMRRSLWYALLACLRTHVGIHVVDEHDLMDAEVSSDGIRVGRRRYRTVLVPDCALFEQRALSLLDRAVENGLAVYWFGDGPEKLVDADNRIVPCSGVPGTVLETAYATDEWCRETLAPQAALQGKAVEDCYVRRFAPADGSEDRLFAVNVSDKPLQFTLEPENGRMWAPAEVDGPVAPSSDGTEWSVPARCCGLFALKDAAFLPKPVSEKRRPLSGQRSFERLGNNVLRLTAGVIECPGCDTVESPYPKPYFQVTNQFYASRVHKEFLGDMPLEGEPLQRTMDYRFEFAVDGSIGTPELVLDPRFARGRFRILVNGRQLGDELCFPRETTAETRLPVANLTNGGNRIEFRFQIEHPMEGMLTQAFLEGDFDVDRSEAGYRLSPTDERDSPQGWTAMGMVHYMGDGAYRWRESFTDDDRAEGSWRLELDRVVDSAELLVNGVSQGTRAWAPFAWELAGLVSGDNDFELVVSSSPGNRLALKWPDQPQGWLGDGRLVQVRR